MVLKHPAQKRNISLHTSGVELVNVYIFTLNSKKKIRRKKEIRTLMQWNLSYICYSSNENVDGRVIWMCNYFVDTPNSC